MSAVRKLARRQAKDTRIAGNKHPNPVKEIVRKRKLLQQKAWMGQRLLSAALKLCGHYVATPRSLDQFHEAVYVRGTTISPSGILPVNYGTAYESLRLHVRAAAKQASAQ